MLDAAFHSPFDEQVAFFQAKLGNLIPTRTWREVRHAAHDTGFMVAGAMKADLLSDFSLAVDSEIAEGKSLGWFRQAFDSIVEAHGWSHTGGRDWRSRVIYQTNMATSYAAGRLAQLRDPELQSLAPYWMYVHNDSVLHPRPLHLSWNKLVLPADHPWFKTHYPPNGWGCRCRVTAVSEAQARRLGGRFGAPPDDGINPKTGAPNGIDRGWDYMPGDTVTERIRQTLLDKAAKLPPQIGAALAEDIGNIPRLPLPTGLPSAESTALGERVSAAFILPADGVGRMAMDVALPAIDRVHGAAGLPVIHVENVALPRVQGRYEFNPATGEPYRLLMSSAATHPELTAVHEIGHFLDHQSINGKKGYASWADPVMERWRAAVGDSAATAQLDAIHRAAVDMAEKDRAFYYYRTEEQWARSYSQYIALRGGDPVLRQQVAELLAHPQRVMRASQWADDDFAPIAEAIDDLFKGLGWRK